MAKTYFVTGTDTDVGKTVVSAALLEAAKTKGLQTIAIKPVAAGCESTVDGLRNSDALLLQKHMTVDLAYEQVNPVALEAPAAPHIVAATQGKSLSLSRLVGYCRGALMTKHDFSLIEGAGGWRVPLNGRETLADLPRELNNAVILVVSIKLGCINHALLTAEAIQRDGLELAGWIANSVQPEAIDFEEENISTLASLLPAPCLGVLPFSSPLSIEALSERLSIEPLIAAL
ncbi:dethiobiotin synthase [Alkalimarinus sediminis]|uniref:ATP-dependent dethiobiotin synthetase BioD n=1 Tax=Alkalimarinus sediminis TaxID=1632866 RepID=A0A9E8HJF5_9ALTE|nr:dethiobiotin synthase [Alkalimarinus sediminis]UZW75504.1 dethiobiotin synthase [Alkalimarinus sediminis]